MIDDNERDSQPAATGAGSDLAQRLRSVIHCESKSSFARRAQITDSLLRSYLKGSLPTIERLVRMADAGGVSVEWLAAGRGPRERAGGSAAGASRRPSLRGIAERLRRHHETEPAPERLVVCIDERTSVEVIVHRARND